MMKFEDIKIDEKFKNLLPGLSDEELRQLKDNIIRDGEIRDPLIVWSGQGVLVDGHNRRDVWNNLTSDERKKVHKPQIILKKFASREEALDWMIDKQLGQRNIDGKQRSYLIGLKYETTKRNRNDNLNNVSQHPESSIVQNGQSTNTANEVAEETGVSATQVRRNANFKKAVDAIEKNLGKVAKTELMDKKNKVSKTKIIEIGELEPEKMQAAFDRALGRGEPSGGSSFEPDEWGGRNLGGVKDGLKTVIPETLNPVFTDVKFFDEKVRQLQAILREIREQSEKPSGAFLRIQDAEAALKNGVNVLKFAKPFTECPTCKRKVKKTCKNCKGSGYITKRHYGEASGSGTLTKAEREWLDKR